jgi:hypothetical protein
LNDFFARGSGSGCLFPVRIRIQDSQIHADPSGSGSTTLLSGIEDAFNGAQFDIATTRRLGAEIMELILKPCLLNLDIRTIAMGQQIFRDPSNYYVWLYRNYAMLGYELGGLWGSFSWRQRYWFYLRTAIVSYIYPLPGVKWLCNRLLRRLIEKFTHRMSKKSM